MGPGGRDIVLHDEEVVRETHPGDGLELEIQTVRSDIIQNIPVPLLRTLIAQMAQERDRMTEFLATVIALLVIASGVYDTLVFLKIRVDVIEEVLVNLELRQDVSTVNGVVLHLVADFQRIGDDLGMVREQCRHLLLGLQILLLGISEAVDIVNVCIGSQTDKPVMGGAVLLAHKVDVIGRDDLHAMLFGQIEDDLIVLLLLLIHLERKSRNLRLVQHHLQIIVILEHPLVPLYGLFRACYIAVENHSRNLSGHTGG